MPDINTVGASAEVGQPPARFDADSIKTQISRCNRKGAAGAAYIEKALAGSGNVEPIENLSQHTPECFYTRVVLGDKEGIFGIGIAPGYELRVQAGIDVNKITSPAADDLIKQFVIAGGTK